MQKKTLQIVVMCSLLCGCTNEIDIDLPPHQSRLVIAGLFETGDTMMVYAGVSKTITDHNFELDNHPQITLQGSNSVADSFAPMEQAGWYSVPNTIVKEGEEYTIVAPYEGLATVTAQSRAPEAVPFSIENYRPNISQDEDGFKRSELSVVFHDNPEERNFYQIQVYEMNQRGFYSIEPWSDDIVILEDRLNDEFYDLCFTDKLFNGKQARIVIGFNEPTGWEGDTELFIYLRNMTEDCYRYTTKALLHYQFQESMLFDGSGSPVNMYNNVTNGYGIFAGYAQTEQSITLKYEGPIFYNDSVDFNY